MCDMSDFLHQSCIYTYSIQNSIKKCPHCQYENSLYSYNYEDCHLL